MFRAFLVFMEQIRNDEYMPLLTLLSLMTHRCKSNNKERHNDGWDFVQDRRTANT